MTTPEALDPERLSEARDRASRTAADEWLLSDCEGDLRIWRASAPNHVTRDQAGEITGFSEPSSYRGTDEILAIELDSWDPGEDATDDQRRTDIGDMFDARAAEPALLADNARLRTRVAELEALAADATEYRVLLPEHGGTELRVSRCTTGRAAGGWAVAVPGYGGGWAWTREGWQDSISALSVDRLFCWPDAVTAIAEARRALAEGGEPR